MFDNPKKELQRLEEQLLAAEMEPIGEEVEEAFDDLCDDIDEIYDEADDTLPYEMDGELQSMLRYAEMPAESGNDRHFSDRAAGFDAEEGDYDMDDDRYAAPPPKKKGMRGLLIAACLEALLLIALALWLLGRLL